jgi:hypothetical protein
LVVLTWLVVLWAVLRVPLGGVGELVMNMQMMFQFFR